MKKRILSLLMAFALAVSLLPAAAAAEEPVYDVTLSTTSIDLGSYPVSDIDLNVTPYYLTVTNTGTAPIYWFYQHANGNGVTYKFQGSDFLQPGESAQLEVSWNSSFAGNVGVYERTLTLYFSYDKVTGAGGYPWNALVDDPKDSAELILEVPVRIELVPPDSIDLTASPSYLDLGTVVEKEPGGVGEVIVTNNSEVTVTLFPEATEYFYTNSSRVRLFPGEPVAFSVWPKDTLEPGEYTETLTFREDPNNAYYSGADAELSFQVHVTVERANYWDEYLSISPTSLDFGSDESSVKTVTITNNSNGTILLEQTTADSFIVSPYDKGRLYAGESATFTVQPKAGLPAGTYDEEIFLDTSAGFFNLPVHYTSTGGGQPEYPSSWAREQVEEAVAAGLVPSFLQTKYTQAATRAEFCALAVELYETVTGTTITKILAFSDTTDINVKKMAGLGVVNGVGDGKFDPNGTLTREQAATILVRLADAMGYPLPEAGAPFADDASIGSWARDAVGRVKAGGIMDGVGNNTFNPKATYSREQSILTILRLYNTVK